MQMYTDIYKNMHISLHKNIPKIYTQTFKHKKT